MGIKYDFYKDVKDKKTLARNAKYKKNGSKSKKCTLPSDYLTRKEKQKMNSAVKTYKMNQKYSWKEFKEMPLDIQREYLIYLRDTYGATTRMISTDLFGSTDANKINKFSSNHDSCFKGIFKPKRIIAHPQEMRDKWNAFISSPPANPINKPAGTRKEQWFGDTKLQNEVASKETIGLATKEDFKPVETSAAQKVKVSTCSISLSGPADVQTLCKSLYNILNAQSNGRQVVSFKFKCEFSMEE